MEQFKLKSIDELDLDFVQQRDGKPEQPSAPAPQQSSLIPEISKDKPAAVDERPHRYFKKTADQFDDTTIYKPFGQSENTSRSADTSYAPIGAVDETAQPTVPDFGADDYGKVEVEKPAKAKKGKSGKGILAGRIISIVLLCATVLTFVFGCVISIFINNNGTNLAG